MYIEPIITKTDFPKTVDGSFRKAWKSCSVKGMLSSVHHIKPIGGNVHLIFGGCFAKGLECYRKAYYGEEKSLDESMAEGFKGILKEWPEDFYSPDRSPKTLEACFDAFLSFIEEHPPADDPIRPLMVDGKPAVEFTFALPIPGILHPQTGEPLLYAGRFDMLATYLDSIYVDDEKTTGSLGPSWDNNWRLSSSITGYIWAAQQFGHHISGAIIRGTSILKRSIGHKTVIEQRTKWQIERWLEQLKKDVVLMIAQWEAHKWDYNLDDSCSNYGGCHYMDLCLSKNPEKWLQTHYEYVPWDPLKKDD